MRLLHPLAFPAHLQQQLPQVWNWGGLQLPLARLRSDEAIGRGGLISCRYSLQQTQDVAELGVFGEGVEVHAASEEVQLHPQIFWQRGAIKFAADLVALKFVQRLVGRIVTRSQQMKRRLLEIPDVC